MDSRSSKSRTTEKKNELDKANRISKSDITMDNSELDTDVSDLYPLPIRKRKLKIGKKRSPPSGEQTLL